MPNIARGRFIWYELLAADTEAAKRFYSGLTGWNATPFEQATMPYELWMNGDSPVGGLMTLPEEAAAAGAPPHWLPYIATPDVYDTVEKAKEMGSTVLAGPMDAPGIGGWAVIQDPMGAVFAVHTPEQDTAPYREPGLGEVSWHELMTTDYRAAFDFYRALFGWEETERMDMGDGAIYLMYGQEGATYGGMFDRPADVQAPPHWLLYIMVDDVEKRAAEVTANGGQILNGPMEVPGGGRIVQCMDPQGAVFALHASA
jgi:predicted enzyme related to lactoylglutathione lyase